LNAFWNPFHKPERRQKMYLRKNSQDNALESVVSVAHDVRDTVTFPKPNQTIGAGGLTTGGEETITIYVVSISKAMDTSGLALDLWNADRWKRGEVGAFEVPAEDHLARFTVRRFYDPRVDSFVVGKVTDFKVLASKERLADLSPAARLGMDQLTTKWDAGAISWLRFGDPEAGNTRHAAMEKLWQLGHDQADILSLRSPTIKKIAMAYTVEDYAAVWADLRSVWDIQQRTCQTWQAKRLPDPTKWTDRTTANTVKDAVTRYAYELAKSFEETRLPWVRQKLNPEWYALKKAADAINGLKNDLARSRGKEVIGSVRRKVQEVSELAVKRREYWTDQRPGPAAKMQEWEAFLMNVLGDRGSS
jgi:hypothetical protein